MKRVCWLFCLVAVSIGTVDVIAQSTCYERCKVHDTLVRKQLGSNGASYYYCDFHMQSSSGIAFGWVMNTTSNTSDGNLTYLGGIHGVNIFNGEACHRDCDTLAQGTIVDSGYVQSVTFQNWGCISPSGS